MFKLIQAFGVPDVEDKVPTRVAQAVLLNKIIFVFIAGRCLHRHDDRARHWGNVNRTM
jgi:hypothetical protein